MEAKLKSKGSEHLKRITATYVTYSAAVRKAVLLRRRLEKLIATFPKKEKLLHQEKLLKYEQRIHGKEY